MARDDRPLRANDDACPNCGVSFQGDPIPVKDQEAFGATHFSRRIGIEDPKRDMVTSWFCPDCLYEWSRF